MSYNIWTIIDYNLSKVYTNIKLSIIVLSYNIWTTIDYNVSKICNVICTIYVFTFGIASLDKLGYLKGILKKQVDSGDQAGVICVIMELAKLPFLCQIFDQQTLYTMIVDGCLYFTVSEERSSAIQKYMS